MIFKLSKMNHFGQFGLMWFLTLKGISKKK